MSTVGETPSTFDISGAPDWSALETDLRCPRCDYNLRMLTLPRCPECGLEFDWAELIAATARERECPIFEYQWRRRPVQSFLFTIWLAVQPWRLWRAIKLEFEPQLGALAALAAAAIVGMFLCSAAIRFSWQLAAVYKFGNPRGFWVVLHGIVDRSALLGVLQTRIAPLLIVLAAIAVYRFTLVRFRIRFVHLVRIAVLSWTGWIWAGTLIGFPIYLLSIILLLTTSAKQRYLPSWTDDGLRVVSFGIYFVSLALAFRRYLRLRRAWLAATAAMTLATVAIIVFTVVYNVYTQRRTFGSTLAPLDEWFPGLQWLCLHVLSSG
jgi:hypothetical protein